MKRIILKILVVVMVFCTYGCVGDGNRTSNDEIVVTIPPLQGLVKEIVGDDCNVSILLPEGSSPETYSPTPSQVAKLEDSSIIFAVGTMEFEKRIIDRLGKGADYKVIDLSSGVRFIEGNCGHTHNSEHLINACEHNSDHHAHHHHIDPHIWMSFANVELIINNITNALATRFPDNSDEYARRADSLINKVKTIESGFKNKLSQAPDAFLIYHPALGYLANDYGLEQISLENEGKSPTAGTLAEIVEQVKTNNIKVLLYQQEYPLDVVKPIADILGVNLVKINPLNTNIISELERVVNIIMQDGDGE